ncbi:hypothetical protein R2571_005738 [Pseudomonas aeruginosa]|nr:hypothetical protein [Pseudomonas aeruginosa]
MAIERVSGSRPYVASWQAYGGHTMYVGVFPSTACGQVLLATERSSEAAGFATPEACAAAIMAAGFKLDGETWVDIAPLCGQLGLF